MASGGFDSYLFRHPADRLNLLFLQHIYAYQALPDGCGPLVPPNGDLPVPASPTSVCGHFERPSEHPNVRRNGPSTSMPYRINS